MKKINISFFFIEYMKIKNEIKKMRGGKKEKEGKGHTKVKKQ